MCVYTATDICAYNFDNVVDCLGLPGVPPPPILSLINVTMVMVRWESPDDTGKLEISHYEICVFVLVCLSIITRLLMIHVQHSLKAMLLSLKAELLAAYKLITRTVDSVEAKLSCKPW